MHRLIRLPWLVVMLLALLPAPAGAGTLTVTRTDDPPPDGCPAGDCFLREAILTPNTSVGPDAVRVPAGRYVLSIPPDGTPDDGLDGDLDITEDLILEESALRPRSSTRTTSTVFSRCSAAIPMSSSPG
jgi:hypothetical protein